MTRLRVSNNYRLRCFFKKNIISLYNKSDLEDRFRIESVKFGNCHRSQQFIVLESFLRLCPIDPPLTFVDTAEHEIVKSATRHGLGIPRQSEKRKTKRIQLRLHDIVEYFSR